MRKSVRTSSGENGTLGVYLSVSRRRQKKTLWFIDVGKYPEISIRRFPPTIEVLGLRVAKYDLNILTSIVVKLLRVTKRNTTATIIANLKKYEFVSNTNKLLWGMFRFRNKSINIFPEWFLRKNWKRLSTVRKLSIFKKNWPIRFD